MKGSGRLIVFIHRFLYLETRIITRIFLSDINECTENTHDCDKNSRCFNNQGSFICICNRGYQGSGRKGQCFRKFTLQFSIHVREKVIAKFRLQIMMLCATRKQVQMCRLILNLYINNYLIILHLNYLIIKLFCNCNCRALHANFKENLQCCFLDLKWIFNFVKVIENGSPTKSYFHFWFLLQPIIIMIIIVILSFNNCILPCANATEVQVFKILLQQKFILHT